MSKEREASKFDDPGTAVIIEGGFRDPGPPPHRQRLTDIDPRVAKRNSRFIYILFFLSAVGSIWSIAAYIVFPLEDTASGNLSPVRLNNLFIGLGSALALLALGVAAVHWGKALMTTREMIDERHPVRSDVATRESVKEILREADKESGFSRRTLIRSGLFASLAAFPLPAIVLLRGLAPQGDVINDLRHTMWGTGVRLTLDPTGIPVKASDVTLGSVFHIIPDGLNQRADWLDQKAKAIVLLMRLKPENLHISPGKEDWSYQGIVAYSKVCTHVGCPVALYEQRTHHLLCPCHQSQFDITREARVIFGPAARPLPQLPITVDDEGYLVARSDFHEPVGPSFWERSF